MDRRLKDFYEHQYQEDRYAAVTDPQAHSFYPPLESFIAEFSLQEKRCLEVGCGRGAFQDVVPDYTGVDISESAGRYLHKPFSQSSATDLPFPDNSFDAIWSYAVLEHVPEPEKALQEMRRVLVDNGVLLLAPAWQCRPWAAEGYPVRSYSELNVRGKLVKASIPVRDSILFRATYLVPRRTIRLGKFLSSRKAVSFKYEELVPNYDHYWMSDSDAINSMDPFDAILWFVSRGDDCLNYPTWPARFAVRTGALAMKIRKPLDTTETRDRG
jgi:ubiquinone/menaquinone biosynthesis C-methylase UbiE